MLLLAEKKRKNACFPLGPLLWAYLSENLPQLKHLTAKSNSKVCSNLASNDHKEISEEMLDILPRQTPNENC